ncbi:hypothetical protein L596_016042 [Steinernema carpocapsae]|uniref:Uncharacterized protein n=1 Tax=Steinernema carpocapsae TaxID=34508 RepID=A0A4U5NHT0_STECR|nr:hypothetical protein L596_016042 [Steinernema carpocapsae]
MSRFLNKVAVITGSSNGIGRATAIQLATEGASVTIHGRSEDGLKKTQALIQEKGIPADRILLVQGEIQNDHTIQDLVEKTMEKFGRLDVVINNAGTGGLPGMDRSSIECYDYIHEINIKPVIKINKLAEPHLEKTKGSIVNISSVASVLPVSGNPLFMTNLS